MSAPRRGARRSSASRVHRAPRRFDESLTAQPAPSTDYRVSESPIGQIALASRAALPTTATRPSHLLRMPRRLWLVRSVRSVRSVWPVAGLVLSCCVSARPTRSVVEERGTSVIAIDSVTVVDVDDRRAISASRILDRRAAALAAAGGTIALGRARDAAEHADAEHSAGSPGPARPGQPRPREMRPLFSKLARDGTFWTPTRGPATPSVIQSERPQ
jgi:hypothetical protein